jgi:hypothetical protein
MGQVMLCKGIAKEKDITFNHIHKHLNICLYKRIIIVYKAIDITPSSENNLANFVVWT